MEMPGHWVRWILLFVTGLLGIGCEPVPKTAAPEYIIKAGPVLVTQTQFLEELDLKLTAYPYDIKNTPDHYNEVVVDLVATLSEETLLLAVAQKKGITVTRQEVDAAKEDVKASYPGDSFEQMLLENAISYMVWEKKLQKSLQIEKLVRQELVDKIQIGAEDVKAFFEKHKAGAAAVPGKTGFADETELLAQLRREKSEMLYQEWVQSLKQDISVDINKLQIAQLLIGNEKKGISND
jgi:MinD-like ATPase involved in chromosome partitioning or flagellar assembly